MGDRSTIRPARRCIGVRIIGPFALVLLAVFFSGSPSMATVASKATTSREAREAAVQAIPFDQLTEETRQKLTSVTSSASMYRRMPVKVIDCNPDLYVFLVRYPEVVVNIWQLMGISKVTAQRTGDFTLTTSDGGGTTSQIELVYGTRDKHLFYATAVYDGPLTRRPVNVRCVLLLQSGYLNSQQGRSYVASQLDVFVKFDHLGADIAARTLHPWLGKTADYNFTESVGFLQQISHAAETNTYGVRRLAARLTSVEAEVRQYFVTLALRTSQQMAARRQTAPAPPGGQTSVPREFQPDTAGRPLGESR
jgi:hypothetical protein